MLSTTETLKLIKKLEPHTITSINNTKNRIFPITVTDTSKDFLNEDANKWLVNKSDLFLRADRVNNIKAPDSFVEKDRRVNFFVRETYKFLDNTYSHVLSDTEPNKSFGVLEVDNLPFRYLYKRRNSSFCTRLDRMIFNNEIEPLMLFINGEFVPWDCINIIYDAGTSYIILQGYKYNYYNLLNSKFSMIILPFKVSYIGIDEDYLFNIYYNAFVNYIIDSINITDDGKLQISIPDINTEANTPNFNLNIGAWYYQQLKLNYLGLLSEDRIDLLRKIPINKVIKDLSGKEIYNFSTTFNCFDKDSYDIDVYESMCDIDKDNYESKSIFRFDTNGRLYTDGSIMICLVDDLEKSDISYMRVDSNDKFIYSYDIESSYNINTTDYLVFKNNLFDPYMNNNIITGINNNISLINENRDNITIICVYNKKLQSKFNNTMLFNKDYFNGVASEYIKQYVESYEDDIYIKDLEDQNRLYIHPDVKFIDNSDGIINLDDNEELILMGADYNVPYMDKCVDNLDFEFNHNLSKTKNSKNISDGLAEYNPLLFNNVYDTRIRSITLSGVEANEKLTDSFITNKRGLKIPRKYKDHESYALVFVNGELIETYSDMIVFPNYLFIPVDKEFAIFDSVEILFFNDINNNELRFTLDPIKDSLISVGSKYELSDIGLFEGIFDVNELSLFVDYPSGILSYPTLVRPKNDLAFKISNISNNKAYINSFALDSDDTEITACSTRKFIYQNIHVENKAYKIKIDKRFKYCNNQRQYMLFINGRKMLDDSFLITIPSVTRPFTGLYLYVSNFVGPEDRVELFYVPSDILDLYTEIEDDSAELQENGYIEINRQYLDVPLTKENYLFFINGKKISNRDIINISSDTVRISKDELSTGNLSIIPIYNTDKVVYSVKELLKSDKYSVYENIINYIKNNETVGYDELDRLFNTFVKMTNIEKDLVKPNVRRIAIINEIIRDFWVTSGYDYATKPFIYDYYKDEFMYKDDNGNYISPALDANPEINIPKINKLEFLYAYINSQDSYFAESGCSLINPVLSWEYNINYIDIKKQLINDEEIDSNDREFTINGTISTNTVIKIHGESESHAATKYINIEFVNGIYYGLVDEDSLQYFKYKTKIPNRDNKVVDEYYDNSDMQRMLPTLNKVLQDIPDIKLNNYIIGNNNYFIFAAPKRLVMDENDNLSIKFKLPDINSKEVINQNRDDKTTPIYTNGLMNNQNTLIKVNKMEMIPLTQFDYTNQYNYTESYVVFRSNGFFTRLFDATGFDIQVKTINK